MWNWYTQKSKTEIRKNDTLPSSGDAHRLLTCSAHVSHSRSRPSDLLLLLHIFIRAIIFFFFIVSNEINTRLQYLTPRIFHEWQKRYSENAPWLNQLLTWGFLLTHTERQPTGSLQYQTGTTPDQAEVYTPDCLGSHIPGQLLISIFFSSNNAFVQLYSIDIYNENIHSFISIFVFDVHKFCAYMHICIYKMKMYFQRLSTSLLTGSSRKDPSI